jgi:ribosomal protein S18 acetylase RimI-like enzyme
MQIKDAKTSDILNLIMNNQQFFYKRFSYSKEIPQSAIINEFIERLRKRNSEKILQLGLFDSSGKIHGGSLLYVSEWDTQHFGIKVGKIDFLLFDDFIELNDRLKFLKELYEKFSDLKFQVVFLRHSLSDSKTIFALSKAGWFLADVLLTFHRNLEDLLFSEFKKDFSIRVREARKEDSNSIGNLARRSFGTSHFHSDPNLPHVLSSELYAKWSISSLSEPLSKVFVAEDNEVICGFIVCSVKSLMNKVSYGVIDLIAVDQNKQKMGIGKLLLTEALKWLSSQVSSVYVGTQATNVPAVRLYESIGFKLVDSEATFHLWVSQEHEFISLL